MATFHLSVPLAEPFAPFASPLFSFMGSPLSPLPPMMPHVSPIAPLDADSKAQSPTQLGTVVLVLHAHLPYVLSHGKWPHGTDWLCEAVAESYLPLLKVVHGLVGQGKAPRLTLSLTPVLCEQLRDERFAQEFAAYCGSKIMMARANALEFEASGETQLAAVAAFWEAWYSDVLRDFTQTYGGDIVGAFGALQDAGHLEILTCAATHAYLPLLDDDRSARAQIALGVENYRAHFGRAPRGVWLPQCAYRTHKEEGHRGTAEMLSEAGLGYFIGDGCSNSGEDGATREGYHVSHIVGSSPLGMVPRATHLSQNQSGLPYAGDGAYLDFHQRHDPGGHRLWRITDAVTPGESKHAYDPAAAQDAVARHAAHFCDCLRGELREGAASQHAANLVCLPLDAEILGHRWFEGPQWLACVLTTLAQDESIATLTAAQYLEAHPPQRTTEVATSHCEETWQAQLAGEPTAWFWDATHACERTLHDLVTEYGDTTDVLLRALVEQCARELLLLQSSDWPALLATDTARDYATSRATGHLNTFQTLTELADKVADGESLTEAEAACLSEIKERDNPFPRLDLNWWV